MEDLSVPYIHGPLWTQIFAYMMTCTIILINTWQAIILVKRRRKTSFEKLLLSLSVSELMIGVFGFLAGVAFQIEYLAPHQEIINTLWFFLISYTCLCELSHLSVIALDRAFAIVAPLRHRNHVSGRRINISIALCWFLPLLVTLSYTAAFFLQNVPSGSLLNYYHHLAILILCVDCLLIGSYGIMIYTLCKGNRISSSSNNVSARGQHQKTLFLCISYALVFVITTTPFVVVFLVQHELPSWFENGSMAFYVLNSIGNTTIFLSQHYYKKRRRNSVTS